MSDTSSAPPSRRQRAAEQARHIQRGIALGVVAVLAGLILAVTVHNVLDRIGAGGVVRTALAPLLWRAWVWGALPALAYGLARVVSVRPVAITVAAVVTGELFFLGADFVAAGVAGIAPSAIISVVRVGSLVGGTWATLVAMRRGSARRNATLKMESS